jgi:predicted metal-dependent peptidase
MAYTQDSLASDIRKVTRLLQQTAPFFYVLPFKVISDEEWAEKVPSQKTPTAFADNKGFFFASSFMEFLPENKRLGLLLHEVLHPALGHISNKWIDKTISFSSFAQLRNIAMDIVIESATYRMSIELSPDKEQKDRLICQQYSDEMCQKYPDLSWREVYTILRNQATVVQHGSIDSHGEFGQGEDQNADQWAAAAEESKSIAERIRSTTGSNASTIEVKMVAPELPWTSIMRDHLQNIPAKIYPSWDKIKRRPFSTRGEYVPHDVGNVNALETVAVWMDTSGSMCSDLDRCSSEVSALLWQLNCKNLILVEYDTRVCSKITVEVDDAAPPFIISHVHGGGGTDIRSSILQLIEDNDLPGDDIPYIILTDGGDNFQLVDLLPDYNLTFIVYGGGDMNNDIGRVIRAN